MSPLPCGLSRDHRPRYVSGTPRPYAGGRIWIGRFSSLPCARRNGRASASLTARGGGLPIGVRVLLAAEWRHRRVGPGEHVWPIVGGVDDDGIVGDTEVVHGLEEQ